MARGLGLREGLSSIPPPTIPIYHAPKEVTLDLFKSFTTGIELVRDQKLGKPLGASPAEAKPKLAAFWRSGLTFDNAAGNLEGVQRALRARRLRPSRGRRIRLASRIRSCSISTMPSRSCAVSTSRWPRWSKNEDLRAKIEALARRA